MSVFTIFDIIFAFIFYPMFISNYHKKKPYYLMLVLFLINTFAALYGSFSYLGVLK